MQGQRTFSGVLVLPLLSSHACARLTVGLVGHDPLFFGSKHHAISFAPHRTCTTTTRHVTPQHDKDTQ